MPADLRKWDRRSVSHLAPAPLASFHRSRLRKGSAQNLDVPHKNNPTVHALHCQTPGDTQSNDDSTCQRCLTVVTFSHHTSFRASTFRLLLHTPYVTGALSRAYPSAFFLRCGPEETHSERAVWRFCDTDSPTLRAYRSQKIALVRMRADFLQSPYLSQGAAPYVSVILYHQIQKKCSKVSEKYLSPSRPGSLRTCGVCNQTRIRRRHDPFASALVRNKKKCLKL